MTCVFPQLSSELRKQSAAWVLCAGDSRIGCEEWSLPLSRIPAHLSPSAQSRSSQHFTPPQRHNLHRDAFVLQTISLSLKLSLYDWQNVYEGHDTSSLHRCTVKTEGATAFQSITAWTLHHCQRDLWENWKEEWLLNGRWKERKGKERKGKERKGKERKGKERKGKERKGKERKGKERKGKERKGKEILTTIFIIFYLHSIFFRILNFYSAIVH